MRANRELTAIRKRLSHLAMKWTPSCWLDTSIPELNAVMGHTDKGLSYGRMIEVSGWESSAKTSLMLSVAAIAQRNGAHIIWGDVENSFEADWAIKRGLAKCPKCKNVDPEKCTACEGCGLDVNRITLIQPYVGTFENEKQPRLSTAQELCSEIEESISLKRKEGKCFVVLDSIAALLTEGEGKAGIEGSNMRSNMELPMFMGRLLRRWVGLAQIHNALIVLVNQLRESPSKYGGPYTPGGNAPRFYSHVRIRVKRVQGSKIVQSGKTVGIKGIITATKNKAGGREGAQVGFKLWYEGPIEFLAAKDVMPKAGE